MNPAHWQVETVLQNKPFILPSIVSLNNREMKMLKWPTVSLQCLLQLNAVLVTCCHGNTKPWSLRLTTMAFLKSRPQTATAVVTHAATETWEGQVSKWHNQNPITTPFIVKPGFKERKHPSVASRRLFGFEDSVSQPHLPRTTTQWEIAVTLMSLLLWNVRNMQWMLLNAGLIYGVNFTSGQNSPR